MNVTRRRFLKTAATGVSTLAAPSCAAAIQAVALNAAAAEPPRRILLANGWHCVNIGDVAHAPGMLQLIETSLPGVETTLWPHRQLTPEVVEMLRTAFPRLTIWPHGGVENGRAVGPELKAAIEQARLLIVGSGGIHTEMMRVWRAATDKPFGAYGVSIGPKSDVELLSRARFLFCRDTLSVDAVRQIGVKGPTVEFAPDSTFALHLRDDRRAEAYLRRVGLADRPFLAVIPRARYSPYWDIYGYEPNELERRRRAENAEHAEADHAALRELIVDWVRRRKQPVLACPEMTYQAPLAKQQLVDPLPDDVKPHVVWRDTFWRCDEAAAVLARAALLTSLDCHAPIIALVNGVPAIHLRLPTDTTKSQMFLDLGLHGWRREAAETDGRQLIDLASSIVDDPPASRRKVAAAMAFAQRRQAASMQVVGAALG